MIRGICIVLTSLAIVGCDYADRQDAQHDDPSNPYYKKAQQDLDDNNPSGAVSDYEQALGINPKLAGAQYELGVLYSEKLNDPIGSIFHFKRYLELAPNSDKADQVKALIDKQSQAFAASLPNSPTQSANDYAQLQADNATLKKQVDDASHTIAQLQAQLVDVTKHSHDMAQVPVPASTDNPAPAVVADASTPTPAASSSAPATSAPANADPATPATNAATSTTPPRALPVDTNAPDVNATPSGSTAAVAGGSGRTYTVVKGDSLWKIAHKMYPGDTKNGVDKIEEANKDAIGNKPLKIGQVLVIPQ
ncbi:MAG: LysM peptidoglycan-binding domain-containing protein [Methylacidiphilales bacterium]|nr:LysM peptidoglycan-binding domain-containing protein [Candidatus Methylacidiphilales bacterium]